MEKYQADRGYGEYTHAKLRKVGIIKIDIEKMTGKENLGDDKMKKAVQKALKEKVALPVTLERSSKP